MLLQAAVKQLGGARMCVEGYEEGRVTHLIMGAERRTLKVRRLAGAAWLLLVVCKDWALLGGSVVVAADGQLCSRRDWLCAVL